MNDTIQHLNWRYATKVFDKTKKLSLEQLEILTEALRLSPSSLGMQPWKFIVIENNEVREKLAQHSGNPQIQDASHLVVLCARTDINEQYVEDYIAYTAKVRNIPVQALDGFKQMILGMLSHMDAEARVAWAAKQAYIALGFLMSVAALNNIDTCPMEGFNPAEFDRELGLADKNLRSVVLCALGFRSEEDKYAHLAKVRFPEEEVIVKL